MYLITERQGDIGHHLVSKPGKRRRQREDETERLKDADLEDCSDVASSQGTAAATRSGKKHRKDSFLDPVEPAWPYQPFDFGLVRLTSNF